MKPKSSLDPVVLEQLKLEAQNNEQAKINYHGSDLQRTAFRRGYLAGSIAEREKAMELVEALTKIAKYKANEDDWTEEMIDMYDIARLSLEKYLGKAKE